MTLKLSAHCRSYGSATRVAHRDRIDRRVPPLLLLLLLLLPLLLLGVPPGNGPTSDFAVDSADSAYPQPPPPAVFWSMRSLRLWAPGEHKPPPLSYVAAILHFTLFSRP